MEEGPCLFPDFLWRTFPANKTNAINVDFICIYIIVSSPLLPCLWGPIKLLHTPVLSTGDTQTNYRETHKNTR